MSDLNYKALLADAYKLASLSPDPSTQIGAFLVTRNLPGQLNVGEQVEWLTRAYNKPVYGWNMKPEDWERPAKYALLEHAERNAIYQAGLYGICTAGSTMIASWAACADCARAIVQSGIKKLVRHYPPLDGATERWLESVSIGDRIMKAGGVELVDVIGYIPNASPVLRNGELFHPGGLT